jgi:WD40 repeat protein
LYDLTTTQEPRLLPGLLAPTCSVAFEPSSGRLAAASCAGSLNVWEEGEDYQQAHRVVGDVRRKDKCLIGFEPGSGVLAANHCGVGLRRWDLEKRCSLTNWQDSNDSIATFSFRSAPAEWATVCERGLRRWQVPTGNCLPSPFGDSHVDGAVWSPGGETLAGIIDGRVHMYHATTGEVFALPRAELRVSEHMALAFSPDGKLMAGGLDGGGIGVWSVADRRLCLTLPGNRPVLNALDFSPDGKTLASAGADGAVRLWHLSTARELLSLTTRPGANVRSLAFARNGNFLAAALDHSPGSNIPHTGGVALWRAGP